MQKCPRISNSILSVFFDCTPQIDARCNHRALGKQPAKVPFAAAQYPCLAEPLDTLLVSAPPSDRNAHQARHRHASIQDLDLAAPTYHAQVVRQPGLELGDRSSLHMSFVVI